MPPALSIDKTLDPALEGLEPKLVWQYFNELRQIPRDSHKEAAAMQWIRNWAEQHGFVVKQDGVGNLAVHVPATPGYERRPSIVCQSHVDMVCVRDPDHQHNFDTDPIQLERYSDDRGAYIKAKGTTLGTDNGSAVSTFMAIATDPTAIHPPLELLFTVDEEDTFTGAKQVDVATLGLRGRYMINLDTSEVDKLCIGSAGYNDVEGSLPLQRDATDLMQAGKFYEISLAGLQGGHSGDDIIKKRGNAILMLGELVALLPKGSRLVSFNGGQKANAIPSDARCVVYVPEGAKSSWEQAMQEFTNRKKTEFQRLQIVLSVRECGPSETRVSAMTVETHDKVMGMLGGLPNEVLRMSEKIPGLPATSSNIGRVTTGPDTFQAEICVRGAVTKEMQDTAAAIGEHLASHGFSENVHDPVPSWDENPDSDFVRLAAEAHEHVMGKKPELTAFHSCLECGVIATRFSLSSVTGVQSTEKFTPVATISAGPTNLDEHSTMERIDIASLIVSYERTKYMLKRIAEGALDKTVA